ncbi:MAG: class I tRNA ligase family protein, partial [Candidatus Eremiobacteraeota bacterium]|nr:class I tRNA ligase family protein [Candidatus Eremiobacteraeota bacterium]
NRLRARTIDAIKSVGWVPSWGELRITQMLENHPEWCISRQRTWGTPIPAVVCVGCGEAILSPEVARIAARRFREVGANAWYSDDVATFLPPGFSCPKCHGTRFEKEKNIVDIWFESGVSHLAVLGKNGMPWPSDVVLEGGDQYRGWFRSSIVTAVAVKGEAPYKHVVKNGWVNDEQGRPMSKSRGTGIDARDAMDKWGADVLRLWAASVEFVDDVRFGPNVIEQVGRVYRNIRNRIRFMLLNLDGLAAADVVPREKMQPIDALACNVVDVFVADVKRLYDAFGIHDAYLRIIEFESAMSSLYFDALKDPLYTLAENDARRRSAQSALLYALKRFLTAIAPVLSFTAEEAWQEIPASLRGSEESVFDSVFSAHDINAKALEHDVEVWELLRQLRAKVAAGVETAEGIIRDYETSATVGVPERFVSALTKLGDNLREALVVSQVNGIESIGDDGRIDVRLEAAHGEKCRRCWKYRKIGGDQEHPSICQDCAKVVRSL